MVGRLYQMWLDAGDGRTLREFVAHARELARQQRHVARMMPIWAEQARQMQNAAPSGLGLQNANEAQRQAWSSAIGGGVGTIGRILGG